MARTLHRTRLVATIEQDTPFTNPTEWQKALDDVAAKVAALKALGAEVTEKSWTVRAKE